MNKSNLIVIASLFISSCATQPLSPTAKDYRARIFDICEYNYMSQGKSSDSSRAMCTLSLSQYLDKANSSFEKSRKRITANCIKQSPSDVAACVDDVERKHWANYELNYLSVMQKK